VKRKKGDIKVQRTDYLIWVTVLSSDPGDDGFADAVVLCVGKFRGDFLSASSSSLRMSRLESEDGEWLLAKREELATAEAV
jgi:hypothetical protein